MVLSRQTFQTQTTVRALKHVIKLITFVVFLLKRPFQSVTFEPFLLFLSDHLKRGHLRKGRQFDMPALDIFFISVSYCSTDPVD